MGIYKTYEEFITNSPGVQKPLKMVNSFDIDPETKDTSQIKMTYEFLDSSKKIKKMWGLCDGKSVYMKVKRQGLISISFIGKYSFAIFDEVNNVEFNPLFNDVLISAVDALLSPKRKEIFYFNEKGNFMRATNQAIGWLIRKEIDLFAEFNGEKKFTLDTYRKYLEVMNKRHPLQ
ncbi:MAG: hypothetical protein H7178_03440 [Chitinophagaceae bacterium]|nr:hypothetical protein [Chitinophagaceae bacterium]